MHYKQTDQTPKTFILILKTGDALAEELNRFAIEQSCPPLVSRRSVLSHQFPWVGKVGASGHRSDQGSLGIDSNGNDDTAAWLRAAQVSNDFLTRQLAEIRTFLVTYTLM